MDSPARTKADSGAVVTEEQAQEWARRAAAAGQPRLRILTGDRTTGKLHLGHYVGSLKHRVKYQSIYDTYILMADVQALTTHYDRPEVLRKSVREVLLDYLAAGLDPWMGEDSDGPDDGTRPKIVVQSMVPSIAELTVFYGLLIPNGLLIHNPTVKAEAKQYGYGLDDESDAKDEEDIETLIKKHKPGMLRSGEEADQIKRLGSLLLQEFPELSWVDATKVYACTRVIAESKDAASHSVLLQYEDPDVPLNPYFKSAYLRKELRDLLLRRKRQKGLESMPYGFLGYPISQAADITFVGAHLVPVGPDQVPLIELCREVVHRFNAQYGSAPANTGGTGAPPVTHSDAHLATGDGARATTDAATTGAATTGAGGGAPSQVLTTPFAMLGVRESLPGIDGNAKMGKSLGNAINLSDTDDEIWAKVKAAPTDPQRMRRNDPGRPEVCNIFSYHRVFNSQKEALIDEAALGVPSVDETAAQCRSAGIGCVDCKKNLCAKLKAILDPMRERRAMWEARPADLEKVLRAGTARASEEGEKTLSRVKAAMHMNYFE
jgi:tryptophanyl-tRNA synthetase